MTCPGCRSETTVVVLDGHYGRPIPIDLCPACNSVWFDGHEDLELAPGAVVRLFEAMGRASGTARAPVANRKTCPRCGTGLLRTHDHAKQTRYEFFRCAQGHGRFMSFSAFLRAKTFVRDLDAAEIGTLRLTARTIKCVNCGASVDITTHSACGFCSAPIAVLDADQLGRTLADLQAAEAKRSTVDPSWPLRAAQVRRQTEAAFAELNARGGLGADVDLVQAGITLFASLLKGLR